MPGRGGGMEKRCMCGGGIPGGRCRGIKPGLEPKRPGGDCMPNPGGPPGGTWFPAKGMKKNVQKCTSVFMLR